MVTMEFSHYMVDNALDLLKRDYYKILLVDITNDVYEPIIVNQKEWENLPKLDNSLSFFLNGLPQVMIFTEKIVKHFTDLLI